MDPAAAPPSATAERAAGRLTARSVIASTLLGVTPPELPTRSLVATAELLGIAPGTARVAMSRMVAAGELAATGDGYRLIGPLLDRQARQDQSRRGPLPEWDGTWTTAVVVAEGRPATERAQLRSAMVALRHAELREGVWLRPANLPTGLLPDAEAVVAAQCTLLDARPHDPRALATDLWELTGWADRAGQLRARLAVLGARLEAGDHDALAEAFVASADALRHLQADPLLPAELLPAEWPGPALRAEHAAYDRAFKATLGEWQHARLR